ncbi:hypothetical protein [Bythopirellula goksoeyrii]|uniref:Uncharacterized protein n=1 Tax=Bythopirellula goksoeyrii TaxID=1400387 RepID=A0A5B9QGA3_9BACT|nr:hypothetical protein [Bythopirellula goksoeyrii]QEG36700.1 hypothetical protein Pr1d_40360 [Bythopirellula goksoeyrii]
MRGLTLTASLVWGNLVLAMLAAEAHAAPPDAVEVTSGDVLLTEVLATMERRANVSARLRHQSRLADETQVGSGHFWQQGAGAQRRTRWEMQTQVAGENASYVQVYDGRYLWTDRHMPSGRQVHRLDVANLSSRLRTSFRQSANFAERESLIRAAEFRGGISQLLAELLTRYRFDPPRPTQLNGLAVNALLGRWRPEELAIMSSTANAADPDPATWPDQLPHHVLVLVGQSNLFPYVLEFRRASDAYVSETLSGLKPTSDPLVRYEIFEVHFADAIDATVLQFKPGDVDWSDETTLVFEKLSQQQAAAEARLAERASQRRQ